MTAIRKKVSKSKKNAGENVLESSVIRLSRRDQEAIAAALLDDNPSVKGMEKLRQAIRSNRKMAEAK